MENYNRHKTKETIPARQQQAEATQQKRDPFADVGLKGAGLPPATPQSTPLATPHATPLVTPRASPAHQPDYRSL